MKYLSQFLQRNDPLDRLRLTVRELATLTRRIRAALPADLAAHVVGCAPKAGAVVIFVDNAAWASQLRYVREDILGVCQTILGSRVQNIQFKLLPAEPAAPSSPPAPLSDATRQLLKQTAAGIDDESLAAALRRLGRDDHDAD